jgi:putative PIG3 family NAD(P)H quinone oxidoreductase
VRTVTIHDGALVIEDRPVPEPGADEALVRVHGAGVNRPDLVQRRGLYPAPPGVPPDVPGLEFAGVVERAGAAVADLRAGDRVFGIVGGGAQAEYLTVPAAHCARVPDDLDLVEMGGVPEAFITAHDAMVTRAAVRPGEWLLVHAVGSGVGTAAVQLAKAFGASVAGTARTRDKLDRCRPLGLDVGIVPPTLGDGTVDPVALAAAIVEVAGEIDVVLDLVGGRYVEADVAASALKGRIVLIGAMAGGRAELDVLGAMGKRLTIAGTLLRPRDKREKADATAAFEHDVVPLLADRGVAPVIERVMPIESADEAYELVASNATFGKIVLDCR